MAKSSRARRNQQIFSIGLSVIVVLSMGLSLIVALNPSYVQQPPPTAAPIFITPPTAPPLPSATPTPVVTPTPIQ
jgi:hypothetical protein